jgi:hypothetical protein
VSSSSSVIEAIADRGSRAGSERTARPGPVARLLVEALLALQREVPACHEAARRALVGKRARCRIDRESFVAIFGPREIAIVTSTVRADVNVTLSRRTILALVRNQRSLDSAVLAGDLRIQGAMEDVSRLGRSMTAFLHGAVRSPSMPGIYARFERLAEARGGRSRGSRSNDG